MIINQQDVLHHELAKVGGKAFALADAASKGANVPEFFVVSADAVTRTSKLKRQIRQQIDEAIAAMVEKGVKVFAVRSSARSEDGERASHAGQFLTLLNQPADKVAKAVEEVFASGLAAHIADYRQAIGLKGLELPNVIVQQQIEARAAGIAFSAEPVSGRRDIIVVCAIAGLGERLVGGEEDGENWHIGKASWDMLLRPQDTTILTEEQARAVAKICLQAEQRQGSAQDIEWAIDAAGKLWHLQNRPITSALLKQGAFEKRLLVLDNSNIIESYPGLVSPLTFSFAAHAYERVYWAFLRLIGTQESKIRTSRSILANMLVLYQGRIYYNLGNWYRLLSFLPFLGSNRQNMESMMGVPTPIPQEAIADIALPSLAQSLRMVGFLVLRALFLPRMRNKFYQRMRQVIPQNNTQDTLHKYSLSQLTAEYRRLEAALLERWDAPILNDVLCMMAYGFSRKYLAKHAGQAGINLHNDVMIGQGTIISAEPAKLIREMGRIVAQGSQKIKQAIADGNIEQVFTDAQLGSKLQAYIACFGDRRVGELKLESPTLDDDPTPLLAAISAAAARDELQNTAIQTAYPDLNIVFGGKIFKKLLAKCLLSYAKARVRDRENLRFERTRIFAHARRIFLQIGHEWVAIGQLEQKEDIFFLTLNEVLGAIEGHGASHDLRALVTLRRAEQAAYALMGEPPERILLRGCVGDKMSVVKQAKANHHPQMARQAEIERQGLACGSGKIKAQVRIITDPAHQSLQAGEVLVARHTDPGWISHFVNASAVVVERGSILSHSAIVSRELGIPCVVGVKDACHWLRDGEWVEVDGAAGIVRKCDLEDFS